MYICICKSVTDGDIRQAVDMGLASYEAVQESLSAGTGCGQCACDVQDVIQERLTNNLNMRPANFAVANEIKLSL